MEGIWNNSIKGSRQGFSLCKPVKVRSTCSFVPTSRHLNLPREELIGNGLGPD